MENPTLPQGHHSHKCGRCRHIWVHPDRQANSFSAHMSAHMCPECQTGPYFWQHEWARTCRITRDCANRAVRCLRRLLEGAW